MSALHPEIVHPQRDWIDNNLRDVIPVARGDSSPEDGGVTLAGIKALVEAQNVEIASLKERSAQSETAVSSFRQWNTLMVVCLRQDRLSMREKEKRHYYLGGRSLVIYISQGDIRRVTVTTQR